MLKRRQILACGAATGFAALAGCASPGIVPRDASVPLRRIGMSSCMDQNQPQPIWDTVIADRPDLFLFGGDNVYCEMPYSLTRLQRAYARASEWDGFARVRAGTRHMAIWDDNDYGQNDGGADFAFKVESKAVFLDFWKVPQDDPRRTREGLYVAETFGPAGRRVQVIMLDGRWFRSPWKVTDQRNAPGKERYVPDPDPAKTMLGEAQWRWLEEQLRQDAQVRIIVSGIQVVTEGHGWERWGNFPRERQRLYDTIARTGAQGVVLLSGDRHIGAMYSETRDVPYTLYEMTSSGITHPWRNAAEAGPNRIGELFTEQHYGVVEIDWEARALELQLKDISATVRRRQRLAFDQLKGRP
ncbi:alkaline phosphatase D family protein [Caenimonas aquaedulcis]|uniref:Alkaline phosphatase family protein n=1 Tax=Caenimonas aquaedulcis TaxID=2793270 RepID=A0A931H254_9BURK|nr:alkaline phosphatase D family protein [Caenimonas aquaedulcis]MBG9387191.1 alkaline phosphatase family protein [Caenimonas aquaedulcis]